MAEYLVTYTSGRQSIISAPTPEVAEKKARACIGGAFERGLQSIEPWTPPQQEAKP